MKRFNGKKCPNSVYFSIFRPEKSRTFQANAKNISLRSSNGQTSNCSKLQMVQRKIIWLVISTNFKTRGLENFRIIFHSASLSSLSGIFHHYITDFFPIRKLLKNRVIFPLAPVERIFRVTWLRCALNLQILVTSALIVLFAYLDLFLAKPIYMLFKKIRGKGLPRALDQI